MIDINEEIDEYFNPQSKILRKFSVPREFFNYNVEDFRRYLWCRRDDLNIINFGSNISSDEKYLIGGFNRNIINNSNFHVSGLKLVLIRNLFSVSKNVFVILDVFMELIFKDGIFCMKR